MFRFAVLALIATAAHAQPSPWIGQPGKDVVWVPTPDALVNKMLDMAKVTPRDYVIDLGSGDGRNVIAAAKRGARALGVEWDEDLVLISQRNAEKAGVAHLVKFVRGDMYEADISQATVLALFLLPENFRKLRHKFERLRPGTRIVVNAFPIEWWPAVESGQLEQDCDNWCTAYLYVVPQPAQP